MLWIEILIVIVVIGGALFATTFAKKQSDNEAYIKRSFHQKRKLMDLKKEVDGLYRTDLKGILRYELASVSADAYLARYKFYIQEMIANGTIQEDENREIIPQVRRSIERLIDQVNLQEKINAIFGDSIFPEDQTSPLEVPDTRKISVDDRILDDIKHEFRVFEKHFHDTHMVKEHEPEEAAREIVDNLPDEKDFTYFFDEETFYIISSDDFGVFVQNVLEDLNQDWI